MTNPSLRTEVEVLVIGAGAAGLSAALRLAADFKVLVLSKESIRSSSTNRAQGGVAAVTDPHDSVDSHVQDTVTAGVGLCNLPTVEMVVANAGVVVDHLTALGVQFDMENGTPHLAKEGAHSYRRVLHVADATGHAIATKLIARALKHPNIEIRTDRVAIDVITSQGSTSRVQNVLGAYVYNRQSGCVETVRAQSVVLATGGASKVYKYTSNPDGATGDGIAIAYRAGCRVSNMEFNQFHPTCLYHSDARSFLISEAVRGEGGKLVLPNGDSFVQRFDSRGELAPRDVVARAIDFEMKKSGLDCVFLDVTHLSRAQIAERFPQICSRLDSIGIDMSTDFIPIVPAAHYTCGGVVVDHNGATDVNGLYAIGETACTGMHGANRLASNSLLECLVYAKATADHIRGRIKVQETLKEDISDWDESQVTNSDEDVVLTQNWSELRRFMWNYVGIVRTDKRLERAARRIELLKNEVYDYYSNYRVNGDLLELRNLILVADLIVQSARWRKESRGLHFSMDYPQTNVRAIPSIVYPKLDPLDVFHPLPVAAEV
ncbi:MAG: L-aspartate oxidase [Gammaproteobacteria bacterium]|nr:L-aspartate oxidase [Gammaproteobacteria bacterium]